MSRILRTQRWWTLLGLALLFGTAGCADTTAPPVTGEVRGAVLVEGVGLAGVQVELSGDLRRETVTDATGRYSFEDVPAGPYVVTIREFPSDAVFSSVSRTAVIARDSGSRTVTVDFLGNFIRTSRITGQVRTVGRPLPNVSVRITGPDTTLVTTDDAGSFTAAGLRRGTYQVAISGFPGDVTFVSTSTTVQVGTGETAEVRFEGQREATSGLVISSLNRRLASGELEAVDPGDLRGRIEVQLTVNPGQETPRSVQLLLGGDLVAEQSFGPDGTPDPDPVPGIVQLSTDPSGVSFSLNVVVNTAEFDEDTGEVRFQNGESLLLARLATLEGGDVVTTAQTPVTLANRNTFTARLEPERGPVAGPQGEGWVGGDLTLEVLPVIYSPERGVSSVTVELGRTEGGGFRELSVEGAGPFQLTFPGSDPSASGTLVGYQTPSGATDEFRVRSALFDDGTRLSSPAVLVPELRIDNVPPPGGSFALPAQDGEHDCCLGNWVGAGFSFSTAFDGTADEGVGGTKATFHAGPAVLSDVELAALPAVETGDDVEPSSNNSAYRAVAVYSDALGNHVLIPLAPSAGNSLANESGAVFGVDLTPPGVRFSSSSIEPWTVNPASGSSWILRADDRESGFSGMPARTTVRRIEPGSDGGGACVFPGGATCDPGPDNLTRAVPAGGQAYFRYRSRVLDRAGNPSESLTAWILRDTSSPQVLELSVPTLPDAGGSFTLEAPVEDNVDLHRGEAFHRFAPAGDRAAVRFPFSAADTLGVRFDGSPVGMAIARWTLPVVVALEGTSEEGPEADAPDGQLQVLDRFLAIIQDAARNDGVREASVDLPAGAAPRSFSVSERGGDEGVGTWRIRADGDSVCSLRSHLTEGGNCSSAPATVAVQARARGRSGVFPEPFAAVHFYAVVDGRARWLGRAEQGTLASDTSGDTGRLWEWSFEWTPEMGFPAGTHPLVAVGVDEEGNALRTGTLDTVTVVGAN